MYGAFMSDGLGYSGRLFLSCNIKVYRALVASLPARTSTADLMISFGCAQASRHMMNLC